MNPAAIIKDATADGVNLALSPTGTIKATGEQAAVNRWLPIIRDNKPAIVATLRAANEPVDPEAIEERAAIMEYDGGLSREEAEALAHAMQTRRMRERGEIPPHYTEVTTCARCGPVHIFPGVPDRVDGCPWCFNRVKGLPVPVVTP